MPLARKQNETKQEVMCVTGDDYQARRRSVMLYGEGEHFGCPYAFSSSEWGGVVERNVRMPLSVQQKASRRCRPSYSVRVLPIGSEVVTRAVLGLSYLGIIRMSGGEAILCWLRCAQEFEAAAQDLRYSDC